MKVHADKTTVTNDAILPNNVAFKPGGIECSSCHKLLPTKEALKSHFQVSTKRNILLTQSRNLLF